MPQHLVLKVAAGVFLGILAALFVYRAFDRWESKRRARAYIEEQQREQKQEADLQRGRIEHAAQNLFRITPNDLINRCGPALQSRTNRIPNQSYLAMDYLGADSHTVIISFLCTQDEKALCMYQGMKRHRDAYDLDASAYESYLGSDGKFHPADPMAEVKELPCLVGR